MPATGAIPIVGRRFACAVCALGLLVTAPVLARAAAAPQPGASIAPGGASATLEQCVVAVDAVSRSATFNGQMSAVPGTRRMAMQITVQQHAVDGAFREVSSVSSSGWRRSEAGVKIYKFVRQITDLPAPGTFRAIVQFRWIGEHGRVVRRAVRRTATCVQPDERPKLVVAQVLAAPPRAGTQLVGYRVVLRNEGRSAAGPFQVALSVDGVAQAPLSVPALDPGARTVVDAEGPPCAAGGVVEVTPDPAHAVAEASGGGQSDTATCPLSDAS